MLKRLISCHRPAAIRALCATALILLLLAPTSAFAAPTNSAFVEKAFQDILLRPASPSDLSFWTPQLESTLSRQQFALDLLNSQEYSQLRANQFYNDYLARTPTAQEASNLTNIIQTTTLPQGRSALLGGTEYFTTQAGGTNPGFLNALYLDLLNRPIDPTASSNFQTQLSGGATRADIANEVQATDEFRTDIVTGYYQQFLHRAPDNFGLNFYTGLLSGGGTEQEVIAGLIGSDEYFQNVPEPAAISALALTFFTLRRRRR